MNYIKATQMSDNELNAVVYSDPINAVLPATNLCEESILTEKKLL